MLAAIRRFRRVTCFLDRPELDFAGNESRYAVVCYRGQSQLPNTGQVDARCNNCELLVFDPLSTMP